MSTDDPTVYGIRPHRPMTLEEASERERVMRSWLSVTPLVSLGPKGLCADRPEHPAHLHESPSLGRFWCTANESEREPGRSQRRLDEEARHQTYVAQAVDLFLADRRWESIAREWVSVVQRHANGGTATVRYPDGRQTDVGTWILYETEE